MDFILFNSIVSSVWYLFTILFVLYRFTSFFTYMYGFVRFCKKLWDGLGYCWTQGYIYMQKRKGYIPVDLEINQNLLDETQPKSTIQYVKESFFNAYKKAYSFVWGKPYPADTLQSPTIPMYKTQHGSYFNRSNDTNPKNNSQTEEGAYFEKHLSDLLDNDSSNISITPFPNSNNYSLQSSGDHRFFHSPLSASKQFESVDLCPPQQYPPSSLLMNSHYIRQTIRGNYSPPSNTTCNIPSISTNSTPPSISTNSTSPSNFTPSLSRSTLQSPINNDSFYAELSKNPYI